MPAAGLQDWPGTLADEEDKDKFRGVSADNLWPGQEEQAQQWPGQPVDEFVPGNIDLERRPHVKNADGSVSTIRSFSFNEDGKEILIPTVAADGSRILSDKEAIEQFQKTGQHLGIFDSPAAANAYAEQLHKDQEAKISAQPRSITDLMSGRFGTDAHIPKNIHVPTLAETGVIPKEAMEPVLRYITPGGLAQSVQEQILPKADSTKIGKGALAGASEALASFTTPENLASLAIMPASKIGQLLLNLGFGAKAVSELPEQIKAFGATNDPEEKAKIAAGITVGLGLPAWGTAHAAMRKPAVLKSFEQLPEDVAATAPATAEPPRPAEDGLLVAAVPDVQKPELEVLDHPAVREAGRGAPLAPVEAEVPPPAANEREVMGEPAASVVVEPLALHPESPAAIADIDAHLRPDPKVQRLLDDPRAQTGPQLKAPAVVAAEGGAIFSRGGTRVPAAVKGVTPRGDTEFLMIDSPWKRALHGLEREGAADVIGRTRNKVGQLLSKAMKRHVDTEQELLGQFSARMQEAVRSQPKKAVDAAFDELTGYIANKENGRPLPVLTPLAQRVLKGWEDVADRTGKLATAHNVQVFDPALGTHRPMHRIGGTYIPRMFRRDVEQVLREPDRNPGLWNDLVAALAKQRNIPSPDAATLLRAEAGRFTANDFMGNLEMARQAPMPEIFYDYDLRQLASRYIPSFSERMAQIIAYGQRLGPRDAPTRPNLWDVARAEAGNADSQTWLRSAEDQAANLKAASLGTRFAMGAQTAGTGLLLSSPTTISRNTLSGIASTWEILGMRRALMPLIETAVSSRNRMNAREIGAVRDNIGDFLHADKLGGGWIHDVVRGFTDGALKYTGYNGSEVFVRSHAALSFSQFAKDAVTALKANPSSRTAKEALSLFKRAEVDPVKIVAENADWKTGPETRKFIRTIIRDTQGGYRFDQVPLWANSPTGRFLYQFGRWGTQRARNIWKNGIKPALGQEVEWHGKKMTRYDARPLLRMAAGTVLLGEAYSLVSAALFDRDRRDASLSEIRSAWEMGDMSLSVSMALERMLNDVIMSGMLGIWGQPIDFTKGLKDQSRLKNPAEPPSMASIRAVVDLLKDGVDQEGKVTKADLSEFASKLVPGAKQLYDIGKNVIDEPLYEAENDVRSLRAAAMRWGRANLIDASLRRRSGDFGKSPLAPYYEPIKDALLIGDASRARTLKIEFRREHHSDPEALRKLQLSVKSSQPFRVGPYRADEYKTGFYRWARKNLSVDDFNQAKRVQDRYVRAAKAAGLWEDE